MGKETVKPLEIIGTMVVIQHLDSEEPREITIDPKNSPYDHARIVENMKKQPGEFD